MPVFCRPFSRRNFGMKIRNILILTEGRLYLRFFPSLPSHGLIQKHSISSEISQTKNFNLAKTTEPHQTVTYTQPKNPKSQNSTAEDEKQAEIGPSFDGLRIWGSFPMIRKSRAREGAQGIGVMLVSCISCIVIRFFEMSNLSVRRPTQASDTCRTFRAN